MGIRRRRVAVGILVGALLAIANATRAADNMVFVPLPPCRVIDTRAGGAGGPLVAGVPRTFLFHGPTQDYSSQGGNAGGCGIPNLTTDGGSEQNLAKAVAINIVAANPAGPGNLRAWPANQGMPTASLINYSSVNIANGVLVPMCDEVDAPPCTSGDITFLASVSGAHLVVDVAGYFHAGSTSFTVNNTALGHQALQNNTTGFFNTANGANALQSNTTGFYSTANGARALSSNTTGYRNTATGYGALRSNTSGHQNTANGARALVLNTTGFSNTANGYGVLKANTTGNSNTATGVNALFNNTTGSSNAANGFAALYYNTTGGGNIGLGSFAGFNLTTGGGNICIGNVGVAAESNTIRIGDGQTRAFVAGIAGKTTGVNDAVPVLIDSAGQLGTISSSREVKQDIATLGDVSERLLGLRPVSFRYKEHAARGDTTPQFGLIAEEVEEVFPELVVHDAQGRPETVKYHLLVPLLLNELQRLERRVEAAEQRRDDGCAAPNEDLRSRDAPAASPRR